MSWQKEFFLHYFFLLCQPEKVEAEGERGKEGGESSIECVEVVSEAKALVWWSLLASAK